MSLNKTLFMGIVLIVGTVQTARAEVLTGNASATGASSSVTLDVSGLGGLISGSGSLTISSPSASYSAPPPGSNSAAAGAISGSLDVGIAPLSATVATLGASLLSANAASDVTGANDGAHTTTADASVANVNAQVGVYPSGPPSLVSVTASAISSNAQVSGDYGSLTPTGDSTLANANLSVNGFNIDLSAALAASASGSASLTIDANSSPLLAGFTGSITVLLNEQIVTGDGVSSSGITVNAIHVIFNAFSDNLGIISLNGDLILAQSQAAQAAAETPVPEPASLAIWSLLGLGGAGASWRKRRLNRKSPVAK
jgi:hypothetical protein